VMNERFVAYITPYEDVATLLYRNMVLYVEHWRKFSECVF